MSLNSSSIFKERLSLIKTIKMKIAIVFALCAIVAISAAPQAPIKFIPVLERTEKHDERGQFALRYLSADGTAVSEQGALKKTADGKDYVLVKEGEYTFTAPDGQVFRTKYVADTNGFQVTGDHLPKSVVA